MALGGNAFVSHLFERHRYGPMDVVELGGALRPTVGEDGQDGGDATPPLPTRVI